MDLSFMRSPQAGHNTRGMSFMASDFVRHNADVGFGFPTHSEILEEGITAVQRVDLRSHLLD
jgi:hypothetical protein